MRNRRRSRPWVSSLVVVVVALCCGGPVAGAKWAMWRCEEGVERARTTVRIDREPIARELKPLGAGADFVEVRWIVAPVRHCEVLPVPGTDPDQQAGIIRLTPARMAELKTLYELTPIDIWTGFSGRGDPAANEPRVDLLEPLLPADRSQRIWRQNNQLDEQFGAPGTANYLVDVEDNLVFFRSVGDRP